MREVDNAGATTKRSFADGMRRTEDLVIGVMRRNKDAVRGFVDYTLNESLRLSAAQPFARALASFGGSWFDKFFGDGNVGAGQAVANTAATYSTPVDLSMPVSINHSGAIVGSESPAVRNVPMSIFRNAPRYHSGDAIGFGERPIIAKVGEGVFTEGQMKKLAPVGEGRAMVFNFSPVINAPQATLGTASAIGALLRQSEQRVRSMLIAESAAGGEFAFATGRRK